MAIQEGELAVSAGGRVESLGGLSGKRVVLHQWYAGGLTADDYVMVPATPRRLWLLIQNHHTTDALTINLGTANSLVVNSGGYASMQIDRNLPWIGSVKVVPATPGTSSLFLVIEARVED